MALVNTLHGEVERGVHLGLDQGDGWECRAKALIMVVKTDIEGAKNNWCSCAGEGWRGSRATSKFMRALATAGQSASSHLC